LKRISILLVLLLAFVVAACSSEQAEPSATASAEATEEATPEPTATPTESEESEDPSESETAGLPSGMPNMNADPELEDRLPDSIGGESLQVFSFGGEWIEMMGGQGQDPSFQTILDSLGADASDITMAIAAPMSAGEDNFVSITAFRVRGASEDELRDEFMASAEDAGDVAGFSEESIGGKEVLMAADPTGELGGASFYLYSQDDTIYWMTGSQEQVTEMLEALP
jgi:hypothetical protein